VPPVLGSSDLHFKLRESVHGDFYYLDEVKIMHPSHLLRELLKVAHELEDAGVKPVEQSL